MKLKIGILGTRGIPNYYGGLSKSPDTFLPDWRIRAMR